MIELVALRFKTYSYLINDGDSIKKARGIKTCVIKRILKLNHYNDCLLNNKPILQSQKRFKNEAHSVYTEQINKIGLSIKDDQRL